MSAAMRCFAFVVLSIMAQTAAVAESLQVPEGRPVMVNGFFADTEWQDADHLEIEERVRLYAKRNGGDLLLAIEFLQDAHTGLDLYIADSEGELHLFHISAALGTGRFRDGEWKMDKWGKNRRWAANQIGLIVEEGERAPTVPEGFEYQLERSIFADGDLRLAFRLKRPEFAHPHVPEKPDPESWIRLEFDSAEG